MKLRIKFKKDDPVKFISHLDMMRVFERAFRRAGLPIAFTKGFNPRPKMSFTPALAVGITSSSEYIDIEFYKTVKAEDVLKKLKQVLPKGFEIIKIGVPNKRLKLPMLNGTTYIVDIDIDVANLLKLKKSVRDISRKDKIIIEKPTKRGIRPTNIAPLIRKIDLKHDTENITNLIIEASIGQQGSVSPKLIILELEKMLGKRLEVRGIHREEIFLIKNNNKILPL